MSSKMSWPHHSWLLLFLTAYFAVQADIGNVHIALKYHVHKCLTIGNALQTNVAQLLQCIDPSLYNCLLFHEPRLKPYMTQINGVCGVYNPGQLLKSYAWNIKVHAKFSLTLNFLHFHLPGPLNCHNARVILQIPRAPSQFKAPARRQAFQYCGHALPWNQSFPTSHASVIFFTKKSLHVGYTFVITYEAFDVNLPSVGLVHMRMLQNMDIYTMVLLARNTAFSLFKTEFYLHFRTVAYEQIIVTYATTLLKWQRTSKSPKLRYYLSDVRMHDGPGTLSPLIVPMCNNMTQKCTYHLSGHLGVLKYRIPMPSNFAAGYKKISKMPLKEHGIVWESIKVLNNSVNCVRQGDSINFQGKSGACWGLPSHSIIEIHAMHLTSYACTYDNGLYIYYAYCRGCDTFFEQYICISTYSEIRLPSRMESSSSVIVVFKTFDGYSDGWVNFTIYQDINCIGMNYVGFTYYCYENFIDILLHTYFKDHTKITSQSEICTDYWLIHDSMTPLNPSELAGCIFRLKAFNVGSFTLTLTCSVAYENLASVAGSHETNYFNMTIEADTINDFPLNLTIEKTKYTLKLPTTVRRSFFFNPASNLHIKLNYSGDFEQFMFVLGMQITQNAICKTVEDYRSIDVAQMYRLNSDISHVYLSALYPYNGYMIKSRKYTGHNRGSCRVLVKGQSCSHSLSYRVIRIHYWPNKKLLAAHRIHISTKRSLDCSVLCTLNVAIWEIIDTGSGTRLLYHEWRRIYHLSWQVIAASHQGFSVHINATCDEGLCNSKLCDVAVAFNIMLKWRLLEDHSRKDLSNVVSLNEDWKHIELKLYETSRTDVTDGIPLALGDPVNGSWNDAHEYCLSKGLYLSTLTATLMERLRYTLNLMYPKHGWKHTDAYIMAGLHRNSTVSMLSCCHGL